MPEKPFHPFSDDDIASFVVYACVWSVGVEGDVVVGYSALDGSSELTGIDEDMSSRTCRAFPPLPCFREECLSLKVLVELVCEFNFDVSEDIFYDIL